MMYTDPGKLIPLDNAGVVAVKYRALGCPSCRRPVVTTTVAGFVVCNACQSIMLRRSAVPVDVYNCA